MKLLALIAATACALIVPTTASAIPARQGKAPKYTGKTPEGCQDGLANGFSVWYMCGVKHADIVPSDCEITRRLETGQFEVECSPEYEGGAPKTCKYNLAFKFAASYICGVEEADIVPLGCRVTHRFKDGQFQVTCPLQN